MKGETIKCCICGAEIEVKESHNPWPVGPESFPGTKDNRCCLDCNMTIVTKARIKMSTMSESEIDNFVKQRQQMPYQRLVIFLNEKT